MNESLDPEAPPALRHTSIATLISNYKWLRALKPPPRLAGTLHAIKEASSIGGARTAKEHFRECAERPKMQQRAVQSLPAERSPVLCDENVYRQLNGAESHSTKPERGRLKVNYNRLRVLAILGLTALFFGPTLAPAASAPPMGTAGSFSVLAGLSMSADPPTNVSGDLGLSPGLAVSRTGTWTVAGSEYFGPSSLAFSAQGAALSAFNNLRDQTPSNGTWGASPWNPGPGVWTVAADATFAGTITLSGGYNDVWVFQVGGDLTFSGSVVLTGNAQACNVFWQVGRDATIAVGSTFVGTLIASRDVNLRTNATVNGRILVLNGALTTQGNTISGPVCDTAPAPLPITPPTIIKGFNEGTIGPGGVARLLITLTNPNASAATLTSQLVDTLPAGLTIAPTSNASTTCIGSGEVGATPGSSTVTLPATRSIPGNGSCVVIVDVTGTVPGTYTNTIAVGALQTTNGNNAAPTSAPLIISAAVPPGFPPPLPLGVIPNIPGVTPGIAVPTLPEWAMIALMALLAVAGVTAMRRRTI